MKQLLKWTAIVIIVLLAVMFGVGKYMQYRTKQASPEALAEYKKNGKEITVFYCRPSKRGREIFGGLVPYNKVWRTGANEATTFETNQDLNIDGKTLAAGKYTLWTIPGPREWTVIWNKKQYDWGVNMEGIPSREPEADVLQAVVPVETIPTTEMFVIYFEEKETPNLIMAWDQTKISVPLK